MGKVHSNDNEAYFGFHFNLCLWFPLVRIWPFFGSDSISILTWLFHNKLCSSLTDISTDLDSTDFLPTLPKLSPNSQLSNPHIFLSLSLSLLRRGIKERNVRKCFWVLGVRMMCGRLLETFSVPLEGNRRWREGIVVWKLGRGTLLQETPRCDGCGKGCNVECCSRILELLEVRSLVLERMSFLFFFSSPSFSSIERKVWNFDGDVREKFPSRHLLAGNEDGF